MSPLVALALAARLVLAAAPAGAAQLTFKTQSLDLPGAPAALIPADVDGDGLEDLAVVVVYTAWDQIGIEESTEMDQVEGLVEVLTIVPTLMDRREVRLYRGRPDGGFVLAGEPLPLPLDVLSMEAGPPGLPVLALTDAGASSLRLAPDGTLSLEPVLDAPPAFAGTGTFLAGLPLVADATGDGTADLLVPEADAVAIFRGTGTGLAPEPVARVPYPEVSGRRSSTAGLSRDVPLPTVLDIDGNGLPDLLFRSPRNGLDGASVALQTAPGTFAPAVEVAAPGGDTGTDGDRVWIGPVDDRPGAELVATDSLDEEDVGVRKEMKQAREPRFRVRVHSLTGTATAGPPGEIHPAATPERTFDVKGWVTSGGETDNGSFVLPGGFQDLNGDGLSDLAITQPQPVDDSGASPPVRLDLFLSTGPAATAGEDRP